MSEQTQAAGIPRWHRRRPNPLCTPQQINAAVYRGWRRHTAEWPTMRWDLEAKADYFYFDRAHRNEVNGR